MATTILINVQTLKYKRLVLGFSYDFLFQAIHLANLIEDYQRMKQTKFGDHPSISSVENV
jgi:hypothetical protein